jgi:hypothetical protein
MDQDFGIHTQSPVLWRIILWLVTAVLLLFSFALLYRFGPNLKDRRWQWSIPGAVVAATLWVASALLFRVYENHFSSQRIYGRLNAARPATTRCPACRAVRVASTGLWALTLDRATIWRPDWDRWISICWPRLGTTAGPPRPCCSRILLRLLQAGRCN